MENISFFSKNLKTFLFANDITRGDLAKDMGTGVSTVGRWINENRMPPGPEMKLLVQITGISVEDFQWRDLTLDIMRRANYTSLLVMEPEMDEYRNNATIKMMTKHITETIEQLRIMEKASEKVLESVKIG